RGGSNERRDNYYNAVLAFYGAWLRDQAQNRGLGFVDMYGPLNAHTIEQRKTDPKFTLIKDAVHPGANGQVVMAFSILQDMGVERSVSAINAVFQREKWKVTGKGKISEVEGDATSLSFSFKANSLPWVLPPDAALGFKLTKAGHKLSNERVRIAGLTPGKYELRIDGESVGTWTHVTLGAKIELQSNPKTPQYKQALAVAMLNAERNAKAVRPLRNHWSGMKRQLRSKDKNPEKFANYQIEFDKKLAELKSSIDSYEDRIYQSNQPRSHRYEIVRATGNK
ncbi:MAG: hypothetical protein QF412_15490, partial [Planctomycetota bacterium]|nr:hypothetical protein [Planctomycetota bacterium]